jgi:ATP-dependent RNA helicase HelY
VGEGRGAHRSWAKGEALTEVLADGITGGDFVRNVKQLVDLLRQIAIVAPNPATAKTATRAADLLFRGVVVASSVVSSGDD